MIMIKIITYKIRFIYSFRFMSTSLSELVDNMSGNFISTECKSCTENNRCKECKKTNRRINQKFSSIYQFCKGDLNKSICCWEKVFILTKIWITGEEAFYSKLNLEGISDADYEHAQKVWEVFGIKNCGEYYDLYVHIDTILLADVFENFSNMRLEIYKLDPVNFVGAPELAWQACLKKTEVKLGLITYYDVLLMIEKGIGSGISQGTHRYAKTNNKYKKNYDKNNESSYLKYLDANNLYGWVMSQNLNV